MKTGILYAGIFAAGFVQSAIGQVVDGVIGAEWAGITPKLVLFNPSAPLGNFGTPTNENHAVAYSVYFRNDSNYLYIGLVSAAPGTGNGAWSAAIDFANIYLDLNPLTGSGSDLGFSFAGGPASVFVPGGVNGSGSALNTESVFLPDDGSNGASAEMAIPWAYLEGGYAANGIPTRPTVDHTNDALNTIRIQLSQSYGYSVAGGAGAYGYERLGVIPEPSTVVAGCGSIGALGFALLRRRRRQAQGRAS